MELEFILIVVLILAEINIIVRCVVEYRYIKNRRNNHGT